MAIERHRVTRKDFAIYEALEPADFTRIHDNDLKRLLSMLRVCLSDYGHPNFTDRHGTADRIREVLALEVKE